MPCVSLHWCLPHAVCICLIARTSNSIAVKTVCRVYSLCEKKHCYEFLSIYELEAEKASTVSIHELEGKKA